MARVQSGLGIRGMKQNEREFLDNQVEHLCSLLNDWQIIYQNRDLPPEVWEYLKKEKFFGMVIPKEYGGHGFSALAHSTVVVKIATRSLSAAVNTMVPNSLGPAEILLNYGTEQQKNYYLPRLAEITDKNELRREIISTSKIILPIISGLALIIFIIKVPLVNILFTEEFKPMLPLFKYQLSGDVIKIASWLIAFQMVSKAMTRLYIFAEIAFNCLFVLISIVCIRFTDS